MPLSTIKDLIKGYYTTDEGCVPCKITGLNHPEYYKDGEEIIHFTKNDGKQVYLLHTFITNGSAGMDTVTFAHVFEIAKKQETGDVTRNIKRVDYFLSWPYINGIKLERGKDGYYINLSEFVFQTDATTLYTEYVKHRKNKKKVCAA